MSTILTGKGVFGGIVFGNIRVYDKEQTQIQRYKIDDINKEILRYDTAKKIATSQLKDLYQKALREVGEANAMIFEIHEMMLEDLDYYDSIINIIKTQCVNAEYAVGVTADNFAEIFASMDDEYMKARSADVKDVSKRLLDILSSSDKDFNVDIDSKFIILAYDLAPSETVQLDKSKISAFVTMEGSSNSHTAILARMMNIPTVVGIKEEIKSSYDGAYAIVDGYSGKVYIDPDKETIERLKNKKKLRDRQKSLLSQLKDKDNITKDGKRIDIYANIANSSDIAAVIQNDAGGIGLFRSEFIYLQRDDYPSEEEQFDIYKDAAEKMAGKRVIIRTLDIGADKKIDYFNLPQEDNPAMGYRAIRICLDRVDVFKTQLRALYRASAFGRICIMFPMIISIEEVIKVKEIINEVKDELKREKIPFSDSVEVGVMIETPAAALISDKLAKEVDFFSIGTNDLSQYTLAIDRQNNKLADIYDSHHEAILKLIKLVVENAHKNGIWVGICGEVASDIELTEVFLSIGIDELSVAPPSVLELRKKVIDCDVSKIKHDILNRIGDI